MEMMDVGWTTVNNEIMTSKMGQNWILGYSVMERRSLRDDAEEESYGGSPLSDKASILCLIGMIMFLIVFSMMKLWLCEGPAVGRIEKEVLKRRKKHIRENIVVKKIIAKETIKSEKERTNLNHLSMGKGGVGVACDDDDDTNTTGEDLSHATGSDVEFVESDKDYDDYDDDCDGCPECQICLDAFEVGDRICWSHNPDCRHVFHIECLEPWLLKHEECPMCRERYILPRKTLVNNDDVESQHKAAEFFGSSHGFVITSDDTIHGDQEDEREAEKARPKDMETNQLEMTATMEV